VALFGQRGARVDASANSFLAFGTGIVRIALGQVEHSLPDGLSFFLMCAA